MRSMTFQIDDQSTGSAIPAVVVTITENADGSLSFTLNVVGGTTGDLRGFFFDLANESRIGTLTATATSGLTEFRQGDDNVVDLGTGANMQGLVGSDGGYDAGVEIGTAGIGQDDYQSFSFRLASSAGALTLDDFANVDFGVRLTSVGEIGRDGAARLLEHTTSAIDAVDDANAITEDGAANTVSGNVFANDLNLGASHSVTNAGTIQGAYGTLQLNADGSYTYTLDNAAVQFLAVGETRTETFAYSASASDEATSSSTDSAELEITITGANDAPFIVSAPQAGTVSEGDDGASRSTSGQVAFTDVDVLDTHTWSASSALYGAASVDADGTWHYAVADFGTVDALSVGELLADGFAVTVDDGHGGTASQDVAITIVGTNDPIAILFGGGTTDFLEDGGLLGVGAQILFSDVDLSDTHTATAAPAASNTTALGTFSVEVSEEANSAFGAANWSFLFDNQAAQSLAGGETAVETHTVTVSDGHGASASRDVTFRVHGVNDAPDITGGVTTGLVYENGGALTARGVLSATDVDHGSTVFWTTLGGPLYGFATVNANGQWTYTLDNSRFQTQQLAQGQPVTDTFTVRAFDQFGAFDAGSEQVVSVTVVGTNDRPNLPPFPLTLSVFEDGFSGAGATSASDIDNDAILHWSLNRGSALGYFADYEFRADSFSIQKNFAPLFFDGFDAGGPPPQAPDFVAPPPPGGSPLTSYSTTGLFQEVDGKLVFSGANAAAFRGTGNNSLVVGNEAVLNTNIDPANTQSGLKQNHQFVVEGVFDLVDPQLARHQYGIQLTDGFNQLADDLVSLVVRSDSSGLSVRMTDNSAVLDITGTVLSQPLFAGSADQIRLRLSHGAGEGNVIGSYDLLDHGVVVGGGLLGQVGIFGSDTPFAGDDNNWIRAGLIATALDTNEFVQTLDGAYGALSVSNAFLNNVADLVYTPGSGAQALAQGESAVDAFFVRTVDQYGMSSAQQVHVTVNGVNDAPIITGGVTSGQVYEDGGARVASGQLTAVDVDHNALLTWGFGPVFPAFGFVSMNGATGQWTYTLNSGAVQNLAQGQSITDTFTVSVSDQHFASSAPQTVTVTITGTDDQPRLGVVPLALSVNEDGPAGSTQAVASDVDNGSVLHWSLNRGGTLGYSADYEFRADSFSIEKNFAPLFFDGFTAGGPPPQAPAFLAPPPPGGSSATNYTTAGVLQEIDGKLVMRGTDAAAFRGTGTNSLLIGQEALVATNVDPANTASGLKKNHQFVVEGVFDLVQPTLVGQQYGVQLTDGVNQLADDLVLLAVRQEADGLSVRFSNSNSVLDTTTLVALDHLTIPPSADQIRLRLSHEANADNVRAFYEFLDDGIVVGGATTLGETGIFGTDTAFAADDNNWIRAGLIASALDANEVNGLVQTLRGEYGTLTVSASGLLTYAVDNANPAVQALNQGQSVVDSFFVRVTDQFGLSSSQRVDVTVNGVNEAPVVEVDGTVFEDGQRHASGELSLAGLDAAGGLTSSIMNGAGAVMAPTLVAPDYHFLIDNFRITRNAQQLPTYFEDIFSDGAAPPSAPFNSLLETPPVTPGYVGISGSFVEAGSRVILDGSRSVQLQGIGNPDPRFGTTARLNTDTTGNLARGLKNDDSFTIEGRFDLGVNVDPGDNFGIRLTDAGGGALANDMVQVVVRRGDAGNLEVALIQLDQAADTSTTLQELPLEALVGEGQIILRLSHDVATPGTVRASFDLVNGTAVRSFSFTEVGHIFSDEVFTRAEFRAAADGVMQNGVYGTLSVNVNGQFDYHLTNAAANVQALAQGEHATDFFTVQLTDAHGAATTQRVALEVVGSNDAPVIVTPVSPVPPGIVVEDAVASVSGQLTATDVDHGATLHWSVSRGSAYTSNYQFRVDELRIVRDTQTIFDDNFDGGGAPPAAPSFSNGSTTNYFTTGVFTESGGKAVLDGALGGALRGTGLSGLYAGHLATLNSNIDATDPTRGLKSDDDFSVEARFDLVIPGTNQGYGVALLDNVSVGLAPDQLGNDYVSVEVARDPGGNVVLRFLDRDIQGDEVTLLQDLPLAPIGGEDQIVLRLSHLESSPGVVQASADLFDHGVFTRSLSFGAVGHIFESENWTRAQLLAFGPDADAHSATGNFGTLSINDSGLWTYALDNGLPQTQALFQGQAVTDLFFARVVDEYGVSTSRPVSITVVGTGEPVPEGPLVFNQTGQPATNDLVTGTSGNDSMTGALGNDFLIGLGGSDRFDYNNINEGTDLIVDFQRGAGGDILDIKDVLVSYQPGISDPASFVQFLESAGNTTVLVNADGVGNDAVALVNLQGVSALLLNDLLANGNLVLA